MKIEIPLMDLLLALSLLASILPGCSRKHEQHEGKVPSADNVSISYDVQGSGKPALVFVHGWCCDGSYWRFQVPHFAKQHKVVTIDLAGHGDSGLNRKNWTIEAFGKDVAAVVEKLDLDRVILIGHSMGGPVNIAAARLMPDRVTGLIGVDTYHDLEAQYDKKQIDDFVSPFKDDFAGACGSYVRGKFAIDADPDLVKQVASDMSSGPPEVAIGALQEFFAFDRAGALKGLRIPIRCINSDMYSTDLEVGRRNVISFEVKTMPKVGHFLMMEDPQRFNQLLVETIAELSRSNTP